MTPATRVLLLSNSTQHGRGYLDHAEREIVRFLGRVRRVVFFPYALADRDAYTAQARERFGRMGVELDAPESANAARSAVDSAECFFTGGGNTFRLLRTLQDMELVGAIRSRVAAGVAYIGSSAGSVVAGPTIQTTKDMPIVEPRSFSSLALVSFQISPHYLDPDPSSTHMGETQEERIRQFHEENDAPVAGLREGSMLRVEGTSESLRGAAGARLFRRGEPPAERLPVCAAGELLLPHDQQRPSP
jgi:dipeptidase E